MQDPPHARTPNGEADLLSGDDDRAAAAVPSPLGLPSYDEDDDGPPLDAEDINRRLDSFETGELAHLEALGVAPSPKAAEAIVRASQAYEAKKKKKSRGKDPDGTGARSPSKKKSRSKKSRRGGSSKRVEELACQTSKIMNDYQAYLAELHADNRNSSSSSEDDIDNTDPVLAMVHRAREDVIGSYEEKQADLMEAGGADGYRAPSVSFAAAGDNRGGGQLQRAWVYDDNSNCNSASPFGRRRGQTYAHSFLRSRRTKRGTAMVAVAAVALVVLGVSTGKSNGGEGSVANLEEFDEEYKVEEMEKIEEEYEAKKQQTSSEYEKEVAIAAQAQAEYYAEMEREVPAPSSSKGATLDDNLPEEESKEKKPSSDNAHLSAEEVDLYAHAVEKYQPAMFDRSYGYAGTTYTDAESWCSSMSMTLCNYETVCPDGTDGEPLGGYRRGPNDWAWIPIAEHNEWVQADTEERCVKYSEKYGEAPGWGISGEASGKDVEGLTRNIMCCAHPDELDTKYEVEGAPETEENEENPSGAAPAPHIDKHTQDLYFEDVKKYQPQMFDRSKGYTGTTYIDAEFWCSSRGMSLCLYEAVCPDRAGGEPLGGYRRGVDSDFAWMPIAGDNEWVQVESRESCRKYSDMHEGKGPTWGITGDEEGLTRNVMCCMNVM